MVGNRPGNIRATDTIADTHACHAENFRERTHDNYVFTRTHEIDHRRIVGPVREFDVSFIDHDDRTSPDAAAEISELVAIQRVPGRVIRIAYVNETHVVSHCGRHTVQVDCQVILERYRDHLDTHPTRIVDVSGIRQARNYDSTFSAPRDECCLQRFIRAGGKHHVLERNVVPGRDGLQQGGLHVVRIVSPEGGGFRGRLQSPGTRSIWILVESQSNHARRWTEVGKRNRGECQAGGTTKNAPNKIAA